MTEKFSFFDPIETAPGVFDREYNAEEFTNYFASLVTTGVMKGAGAELKVVANGSNMVSEIDTGIVFVEGRYYANDSKVTHIHDTESLGKSRIDRIVIRLDLRTESRFVKSFVKKGVASTSPVPHTLQRDSLVYEISLAQVKVVGGQTFINAGDVTDERADRSVCGWAGSKILPNFDDSSVGQPGGIATLDDNGKVLSEQLGEASTANKGVVKLNNTLTSTNVTEAATANMVKALNDGKANRIQQTEINLPLKNGWATVDNNPLRYYKDEFGIVHVSGHIAKGSATVGTFATLPTGYHAGRPTNVVAIPAAGNAIGAMVDVAGNIFFNDHTVVTGNMGFDFSIRV